jgi:hypothetical protein
MTNINPNCDGSHCRHGYKEVRQYPSGGGDYLYLCLPCLANENMDRYMRAKQTGRPEDYPQVSWSTAAWSTIRTADRSMRRRRYVRESSTIIKTARAMATSRRAQLIRGTNLK